MLVYKDVIVLDSNRLALGVVGGLLALIILGVVVFLVVCRVKGCKLRKEQVCVNV